MELDDEAKAAARELGDAVNSAMASSREISDAIEFLRSLGYEPNLSLKLEIALVRADADDDGDDGDQAEIGEITFTDEDRKTLQRMKIRFD